MGGGLPSPEYFPFEELSFKVPTPPGFSPEATRQSGTTLVAGKHDIREGKSLYDLEVSLNYGQSTGSPQLLRFVTEHTEVRWETVLMSYRESANMSSSSITPHTLTGNAL